MILGPKEGGGEGVVSDKDLRRVIEEIDKMRKQIRNSKLKVKGRIKNLEKSADPLERGQIEFEIEMLNRKIRRWEIVETKLNLSIIKATLSKGELEDEIDWRKAGKA